MNGHLNQYPTATATAAYSQHAHTLTHHPHLLQSSHISVHRINSGSDGNEPQEVEEDDDPGNLPDDDLIRWANAQFTVDYQPGVHTYEDELALKIAHSKRLQYQAQQQAALLQHQQQQQQQLGQYQAIPQDSQTGGISLVERSRQRDPLDSLQKPGTESLQIHYGSHAQQPIYTQQQQAFLIQQQQQFQANSSGFPPSLSSSLQGNSSQLSHGDSNVTVRAVETSAGNRGRINSLSDLSSLSLVSPSHHQPNSPLGYFSYESHQEKLQQLEIELEEYEIELAKERQLQQREHGSSSPTSVSVGNNHLSHQQQQDQDDLMDDATFSATHSAVQSPQDDIIDEEDDGQLNSNLTLSLDPEEAARQQAAAEEDKRRRNTAASARFRQKKRLREQILERTAKEMTAKSEILEARARELEMEIKWLRGLIVEKGSASVGLQGVGPALVPGGNGSIGLNVLSSSMPNPGSFLGGSESFAGSSKGTQSASLNANAARRPRKTPQPLVPLAAKPPS
ncbi:hypothetical protein FBU30_000833 [Linnemannia zychae]|nr:hypothetical protein FBU30_000833 [Linnemannia zychae]